MESLAKQAWWNDVPETVRPQVEAGLKAKHSTWHSGFAKKQAVFEADQKKLSDDLGAATTRATEAENNREALTRLLAEMGDGDEPATAERVVGLEASLAESAATIASLREMVKGFESERETHRIERDMSEHERKYPDIFADFVEVPAEQYGAGGFVGDARPTGAYVEFLSLIRAGWNEERAAKVVRSEMAANAPVVAGAPTPPAVVRDTTLPASIQAMSLGKAPASKATRTPNETWDQARARVLAEGDDKA